VETGCYQIEFLNRVDLWRLRERNLCVVLSPEFRCISELYGGPKICTFCTPYYFVKYWQIFKPFHCQNRENICNNTI